MNLGILEKFYGVSEWCNPMSFVPKPDGDVRAVADLVHLNKFVKRPVHPFPTPKDIIAQIPGTSRYFAVFDAKSGYWQIPLDQDSIPLTTFSVGTSDPNVGSTRYLWPKIRVFSGQGLENL